MHRARTVLVLSLAVFGAGVPARAADPEIDDDASAVLNRPAPSWQLEGWINSKPLTIEGLRGKVVLIRWFAAPSCPFCTASAPSFNKLHEKYAKKGLVVVGAYHHKEDTPLDPSAVAGYVKQFAFSFPVAIDRDCRTLERWWLDGHERRYTSVSFLIDKRGIVRHVHLGGTLDPAGAEIAEITSKIEKLLAE
jgi:peroxiredoxin